MTEGTQEPKDSRKTEKILTIGSLNHAQNRVKSLLEK